MMITVKSKTDWTHPKVDKLYNLLYIKPIPVDYSLYGFDEIDSIQWKINENIGKDLEKLLKYYYQPKRAI